MKGTIDNGRLVRASLSDFDGQVGMATRNGTTQIAFFAEIRRLRGAAGGLITLDGEGWRVIDVAPSEYVKGMVVLTVEPIEGEPSA